MKKRDQTLSCMQRYLKQFAQTGSGEISSLLTVNDLKTLDQQCTKRARDYPAAKTLLLFMRQVISESKSCRQVLIEEARNQVTTGNKRKTSANSAYCKARGRLPEQTIQTFLQQTGQNLDKACPEMVLWKNRRVVLTDGSTLSMPDTKENQKAYPQSRTQKKNIGFPILRIAALITLGSGAVLNVAIAPYKGKETGEQNLLKRMLPSLEANDILLADANFENYFTLSAMNDHQVSVVFEKHGARKLDFRKAKKSFEKKRCFVCPETSGKTKKYGHCCLRSAA